MLRPARALDAVRTLRALRQGARLRVAADGVWWTTRTSEGPATARIVADGCPADTVTVEAWGPGAERALAASPALLGLDDDPSGFVPQHPWVAEAWRRHPGLALGRTSSVAEVLLPTIVGQRVPGADARRSWHRLVGRFGQAAPGPARLRLPPDPGRLAELGAADLHPFGIERSRAVPLLACARHADRLQALVDEPTEVLMAGLVQVPGVGRWTALNVARCVHAGSDIVVEGDYQLPGLVAWNLAGERTADDARMLELLEPERPHRARVMQLLGVAGATPPRHGPRLRPAAIVTP